jgi:predicted transposase/invertase (TIGR01784 family)
MLIAEYSYETDIKIQRREAYREGFAEGIEQGIEQGIQQGIEQGIEQGAEQKAIETAKKLLKEGLSVEQIARCTALPLEKVIKLKEEILNQKKSENI